MLNGCAFKSFSFRILWRMSLEILQLLRETPPYHSKPHFPLPGGKIFIFQIISIPGICITLAYIQCWNEQTLCNDVDDDMAVDVDFINAFSAGIDFYFLLSV
jgi:hypothetical protein